MQVNVQDAGTGTVELEVLVEADQYGQAVDDILDQIARNAQIPGFRKGKAPRSMVLRTVNADTVRARAIDKVLPIAYKQALEETGLKPLTDPEVEILPSESEREFRFKMVVHKLPEVVPGQIRGMELTQYVTEITDEDVDREVRNALESHQESQSEPGAEAQEKDLVVVDVDVLHNGESIPEGRREDLEVQLGSYSQVPAIDDDLIGLRAGDVRDIDVAYPPDFEIPALQDLSTTWHVVVKDVRRRRLPELTDDFVKSVTPFDSVQAFRDAVRQQLEERARMLDEYSLRSQAMQKLIDTSQLVFPYVLVDQEVNARLERLERNLKRNRRTIEEFAATQGLTPSQLLEQMHDQAEEDLRAYLLIHHVGGLEEIQVTPEEIDDQIAAESLAQGKRPAIIEIEKKNESRRSTVSFELLKNRVIDRVLEYANVAKEGQSYNPSAAGDEIPLTEDYLE